MSVLRGCPDASAIASGQISHTRQSVISVIVQQHSVKCTSAPLTRSLVAGVVIKMTITTDGSKPRNEPGLSFISGFKLTPVSGLSVYRAPFSFYCVFIPFFFSFLFLLIFNELLYYDYCQLARQCFVLRSKTHIRMIAVVTARVLGVITICQAN